MRDRTRDVVGGAAFGAILGALAGWYYSRGQGEGELAPGDDSSEVTPVPRDRAMRLVWSVVGVVRQVLEL